MPALVDGKYESDTGSVHVIKLTQERLTAAGTAPTAAVDSNINVKVSKTNREYGIRPRGVRLSRLVGTAPNQFRRYAFLPVLLASAFDVNPFKKGQTVTIGTTAWTVSSLVKEDY